MTNPSIPPTPPQPGTPYSPSLDPLRADSRRIDWFGPDEDVAGRLDVWPFHDRRWYPAGDPARWVHVTRQLMFDSIQRCVAQIVVAPICEGATPGGLHSSDDVFRRLHACAEACAKQLYALGQDEDQVAALVLSGAAAAADPVELHPAVKQAIEQWCRDAHESPADRASEMSM